LVRSCLLDVPLNALLEVIIDLEDPLDSKVVERFASAPVAVHELEVVAIDQYGRGLIVSIVLYELAFFFFCFFQGEEPFHPFCFVFTAEFSQYVLGSA
jgi:hypothetical protein